MLELKGKYGKDCKVFTDNIENEAVSQIYDILEHPATEGRKVRIMPDVHAGKGICVGFTSDIGDYVCPSHIGVDISCMMTTCILDKKIAPEDYPVIEHRIRQSVPMGFDINDKRQYETKELLKFFRNFYNKARSGWSDMIYDMDFTEESLSKWMRRIGIDEGVFYRSINSGGGGNHFYEIGDIQGVTNSFGENISAFTIHCGSRNIGLKVCKYWETVANNPNRNKKEIKDAIKKAKSECKDKKKMPEIIDRIHQEFAENNRYNGFLTGDDLKGYLSDMVVASAYAHFNHEIIKRKISEILLKVSGAKVIETIQTVHNYIDFEDRIIRKGSVRSYKGEKFILPFNMRDGIAICEGKSNPDWNCSAPHGAGRLMSRNVAKVKLKVEDFKKDMEGIYTTCVGQSTIDEAPAAYKDRQEILDNIKDTCEVLYFIKPVINLKAK